MELILTILHITVCLFLIFVVLLQSAQAADLAGAFGGGGSQTALGMRGAATLLQKLTTVCAVLFMLTSLSLGIVGRSETSVLEGIETETVPAEAPAGGDTGATGGDAQGGGGEAGEQGPGGQEQGAGGGQGGETGDTGTGGDSGTGGGPAGDSGATGRDTGSLL